MAFRLIIDGYNFICAGAGLAGSHPGRLDLEAEREGFIEKLLAYKRVRPARITVVFDGGRSGKLARSQEMHKGITVLFSRAGEEADDIIKEMARANGKGLTIVTSDRELGTYCEAHGAVLVSSGEFYDLLDFAIYADMKGIDDEADEDKNPSGPGGKRKGPARRRAKKERDKYRKLKKM